MCWKDRRFQARKEHLLDFRYSKITGDEVRNAKVQNKIKKKVSKIKQRQNRFRHVTNNVGRGRNKSLKRLKIIEESINKTKNYHDRYEMENGIINHDRKYFKKAW